MKLTSIIAVAALLALAPVLLPAVTSGAPTASTGGAGGGVCIAHRPIYLEGVIEPRYTAGCSGHDEPELDPVSSAPGSARDLTWAVILPSDGASPVSAVGPAFWFGGTVNDSSSVLGQAFVELQFYPDAVVTACTPNGGFVLRHAPDLYSVCSPVWKLVAGHPPGAFREPAAFNAMLAAANGSAFVMHAGDEITVHWFTTPAGDGFHVTVRDVSRGGSATIVLDSERDGPLMPAYDTQTIGHALGWGLVNDTPNSFVWEIGHTSDFARPAGEYCVPGDPECDSYNSASWAHTLPIRILSVTFGDGSTASEWATVSDFGGKAEVNQYCPHYGAPYCIYPWFSLGRSGLHYGVNYPGTLQDFGRADQFATTLACGGPFGANSTYCDTVILP